MNAIVAPDAIEDPKEIVILGGLVGENTFCDEAVVFNPETKKCTRLGTLTLPKQKRVEIQSRGNVSTFEVAGSRGIVM